MQPYRTAAAARLPAYLTPGYEPSFLPPGSQYGDIRFASPEERGAAGTLFGLQDVSGLESAAKRHLERVVGPEILSRLTAAGLGRSGAIGESLARAGASMALPIAGAAREGQQNWASFLSNLSQNRLGLAASLANPSILPFQPAPTQTTTQTQSRGFMDFLLPFGSALVGGFPFGPAGARGAMTGIPGMFF